MTWQVEEAERKEEMEEVGGGGRAGEEKGQDWGKEGGEVVFTNRKFKYL